MKISASMQLNARRLISVGPWALLLVVLPLLLWLGFWQLSRAEEKRTVERHDRIMERQPPMRLDAATATDLPDGTRVVLSGRYDNSRLWYLDNRIFRRRVGYEVITPLVLSDGLTVLVNRGWWPGSPDRRVLPQVTPAVGLLSLVGRIHRGSGRQLLLRPDRPGPGWPKRIQAVAVAPMAAALGTEVYPGLVRLSAEQPGTRPADWRVVTMGPARHIGYAVTWFALAAVLALMCLHTWWRQRALTRSLDV